MFDSKKVSDSSGYLARRRLQHWRLAAGAAGSRYRYCKRMYQAFAFVDGLPEAVADVLAFAHQLLRSFDQFAWVLLGHACLAFWITHFGMWVGGGGCLRSLEQYLQFQESPVNLPKFLAFTRLRRDYDAARRSSATSQSSASSRVLKRGNSR